MRLRPRLVLAMALVLVLLTGCWDRTELEDQSYIVLIGVDRDEQEGVILTAMVAMVQEFAAGTLNAPVQPSEPVLAATLLTARAATITQAIFVLNGAMTRRLDLRHLRAVVVGESLGRQGLEPVVMELLRTPLARGSGLLIQAKGRAYDVLNALRPVGEVNPGRMAEGILLQAKQLHLAPPVRLHQYTTAAAATGGDPYLPVLAVNPNVTGTGGIPPATGRQSALPGELPRLGGNPVEFVGLAIFRRDRLAGFLNVDETQMLLALRGEMGKAYVTFPDPDVPGQQVTTRFHQENLPRYRATYQGGRPRVHVRLLFEGEVLAMPGGTNYSEPEAGQRLARAASDYAAETIRGMLEKLHSWGADPVGFGHLYRGRFRSVREWEQYEWRRQLPDLTVEVEPVMRFRRFGLLISGDRFDGGR